MIEGDETVIEVSETMIEANKTIIEGCKTLFVVFKVVFETSIGGNYGTKIARFWQHQPDSKILRIWRKGYYR